MLQNLVFLALLSLLPSKFDQETLPERAARMHIVDDAIITVVDELTCTNQPEDCVRKWHGTRKELAFMLVAQGDKESNFARNVHEGRCFKRQCDPYYVIERGIALVRHRSASPWQLQPNKIFTTEMWEASQHATPEATVIAARQAARKLIGGYAECKSLEGAISHYATGNSCQWKEAGKRVAYFYYLHNSSEEDFIRRAKKIWKTDELPQ